MTSAIQVGARALCCGCWLASFFELEKMAEYLSGAGNQGGGADKRSDKSQDISSSLQRDNAQRERNQPGNEHPLTERGEELATNIGKSRSEQEGDAYERDG
jgi:hypothetical protein